MFENIDKNITMLKGAYRKLKSYYYYNKNFILMRKKISDFESDPIVMEKSFLSMAKSLCHPRAKRSKNFFSDLINRIDFYVLPKKFESSNTSSKTVVTNTIQRDKKMKTVNFFINAPIEVYIFDTLWTVFAGKMDNDQNLLSYDVYGNTLNKSVLYPTKDKIAFENRILFNRYFNRYTSWRNNAFSELEKNYEQKRDSILISIDIKSYYYSVAFDFSRLKDYFNNHDLLSRISTLTRLIKQVFVKYYEIISPFRNDFNHLKKNEYPLPIGLFSSMILGNIYLKSFDDRIRNHKDIIYYGRYVDDILVVANKTLINPNMNNQDIISELFVNQNILKIEETGYSFFGYKSLRVQNDKIKIVYVDHNESRAIIDIYNDTIRIIPSQMEPIYNPGLLISNLDATAYSIENFSKEHKIRDIGFLGIDSFKVGRFFSALPYRYSNINTFGSCIDIEIDQHIKQITHFLTGSQAIEYYSNWLNYMYFLVITQRNKQLRSFISYIKSQIQNIKGSFLDKTVYKNARSINRKAKDTLLEHLEICLHVSLAVDIYMAKKHFNSHFSNAILYMHSNMFEHAFVSFPLANYLDYENYVSYNKMSLDQIGDFPQRLSSSFKFIWSPRFIHYDELTLLLFYYYHYKHKGKQYYRSAQSLKNLFAKINFIGYTPFEVDGEYKRIGNEYFLGKLFITKADDAIPEHVSIAVGSVDISPQKCLQGFDRWKNITIKDKEQLWDILNESYQAFKANSKEKTPMILVLPELYFPFYWINDLIRFAKNSQIAVVTGLQYLSDETNRKYNYLATILPFTSSKKNYKNAFVQIREKNDYSPIEINELQKMGFTCENKEIAEYQVFHWKGIRLSSLVCFELTDVMARAILKEQCDIIAVSVFNHDTTYFSNIIDSCARDLHAFIVQANTSHLGDSRVTGPYDRDSKDIFKIKGGENDHVVIGNIEFKKLKDYQKGKYHTKDGDKPEIKPLPARFKVK